VIFAELMILAVGLSMDACAVAICKGACMRRLDIGQGLIIGLSFGFFQALMPLIGWFLGTQFRQAIQGADHWVAFALLGLLGFKMIWDALHEEKETVCAPLQVRELLLLSIATSIDALAAGIALAVLQVNIVYSVAVIGLTTFVLSLLGTVIGNKFGQTYQAKAQFVGGAVLCLIGVKVLIEHLIAA
jgi:putative Mn2+ efflux pump MntP